MNLLERNIYLAVIILVICFFMFFPVEKSNINFCLFNRLLHIPCPLCGMLHSLHYSASGDFSLAFSFNLSGPILFLIMLLIIPVLIWNKIYIFIKTNKVFEKSIIIFSISIICLFWLYKVLLI